MLLELDFALSAFKARALFSPIKVGNDIHVSVNFQEAGKPSLVCRMHYYAFGIIEFNVVPL